MVLKAANMIKNSDTILVVSGAGISTASGIPDFRGKNGLYESCQEKYDLPYPEALFDIKYFSQISQKPFYQLTKEFFSSQYMPTLFHKFIARLEEQKSKVIIVTQNIDGLHQKAGSKNVVAAHGDYSSASCLSCKRPYDSNLFIQNCKDEISSLCECGGIIKPHIVFYGENLPSSFMELFASPPKVDLFISCGTSLTVHPVADFASLMTRVSPSIRLNNAPTVLDNQFTLAIDCDLEEIATIFTKYIF